MIEHDLSHQVPPHGHIVELFIDTQPPGSTVLIYRELEDDEPLKLVDGVSATFAISSERRIFVEMLGPTYSQLRRPPACTALHHLYRLEQRSHRHHVR
ncbi:MAG: hypothetical protein AAF384_00535, partial [Pseudomonadota bacterium]